MKNTLHVEFVGLTGVVPGEPRFIRNQTYKDYCVVFPDISNGLSNKKLPSRLKALPEDLDKHLCAVVVKKELINQDMHCDSPEGEITINGTSYSIFPLRNQNLKIFGLEKDKLINQVREARSEPISPREPSTMETQDLTWMTSLQLANIKHKRGVGTFDTKKYISPEENEPIVKKNRVLKLAATLAINTGRFYVGDVLRSNKGIVLAPHTALLPKSDDQLRTNELGRRYAPEWKQPIYQKLCWDAEFVTESITLTVKDAKSNRKPLVSLYPHNLSGQLPILIVNVENDNCNGDCNYKRLKEAIEGVPMLRDSLGTIDTDFAALYLYSTRLKRLKKGLPVPDFSNIESLNGLNHVGRLTCRGGMFN